MFGWYEMSGDGRVDTDRADKAHSCRAASVHAWRRTVKMTTSRCSDQPALRRTVRDTVLSSILGWTSCTPVHHGRSSVKGGRRQARQAPRFHFVPFCGTCTGPSLSWAVCVCCFAGSRPCSALPLPPSAGESGKHDFFLGRASCSYHTVSRGQVTRLSCGSPLPREYFERRSLVFVDAPVLGLGVSVSLSASRDSASIRLSVPADVRALQPQVPDGDWDCFFYFRYDAIATVSTA